MPMARGYLDLPGLNSPTRPQVRWGGSGHLTCSPKFSSPTFSYLLDRGSVFSRVRNSSPLSDDVQYKRTEGTFNISPRGEWNCRIDPDPDAGQKVECPLFPV